MTATRYSYEAIGDDVGLSADQVATILRILVSLGELDLEAVELTARECHVTIDQALYVARAFL